MTTLKVTQVRSLIDRPKDQKVTIRRLGLHRMHDTVLKEDRPEIRGMIAKVRHLVTVEEIAEKTPKRRPAPEPEGEDS
jgi:large subunit ribosomal protein L30